jgi:hypothetical protein
MRTDLIPAIVNGEQVYVPANQVVPYGQKQIVQNEKSFGQCVKEGAGIAIGVALVALAIGALTSNGSSS